jgi:hypothetical protein
VREMRTWVIIVQNSHSSWLAQDGRGHEHDAGPTRFLLTVHKYLPQMALAALEHGGGDANGNGSGWTVPNRWTGRKR